MATIASLVVDLTANTARFQRNMQSARGPVDQFRVSIDRAAKDIDKLAQKARKTAAIATAAFTGLVAGGAKFVNYASQAEQLNNVVNQAFGDMASAVNKWAEETGDSLGRSTHTMRSYAGYLQAMIRPVVGVNEAAAEMSLGLAELAIDLAAFYDKTDDEAFTALRSAIMGEIEPMKKFGVAMTQAELQAFALANGIQKNISNMTEAEKVQLRYQYIMDRTRIVQGTALREADEYANVTKALSEEFREQAEAIGHVLMPAYKYILDQVRGLIRWFGSLDNSTKTQIAQWGLVGAALLGFVAVVATVGAAIAAFIKGLMVLGSVIGFITSPVVIAITLIALAVAALYTAWNNNWGGIKDLTTEAVESILGKWGELVAWWETSEFGQAIREAWADIVEVWQSDELSLPQKVIKTVSIVANTIADLVPSIRAIWDLWTDGDLSLKEKMLGTVSIVTSSVSGLVESIVRWWINTTVTLAEKVVILLGLNPDENAFIDFLRKIQGIWNNQELTLGEKVVESLRLIPGAETVINFIADVKDKITNSDLWKWTVDVALPVVVDTGETVIKAIIEFGGEIYEAVKTGFTTGDWGPAFGIASDLWSAGALIKLGFELADYWFALIKAKIIKGLGLSQVASGLIGTGLVIGAITIGVQLAEAMAKGDYENFMKNIVAASIAGVFGGLIGGPAGAIVTFDIVLNLKLGETVINELENIFGYIQYMMSEGMTIWDMIMGRHPEDLMGYGEWLEKKMGIVDEPLSVQLAENPIWNIPESELEKYVTFGPTITFPYGFDPRSGTWLPGTGPEIEDIIRLQAQSDVFANLRDTLAENNIVLDEYLIRLGKSESGLHDLTSSVSSARGEFQLLAGTRAKLEQLLGTIDWEDPAQRTYAAIHWLRLGIENEFGIIADAANRLGVTLEEAIKLWWVAGGPKLRTLESLDVVLTLGKTGREILAGFAGGGYTGNYPVDEVVGVVHGQELVIPAWAVRKGLPGILEFLGVPGFQEGTPVVVRGLSEAQTSVTNMQTLFSDIGKTIVGGLAKLFEIISQGIESLAISLVGEEKVAEIKEVFASMRTALDDFAKSLTETSNTSENTTKDQLSWWDKLKTGFQAVWNGLNITAHAQQFYNSILQQLNPVAQLFSALLSELSPAIQILLVPVKLVAEALGAALLPILKALFPAFKLIGTVLLTVAEVVGSVWNTLLDLISALPFVDLTKYKIKIQELTKAKQKLINMTWEDAEKFAELNQEVGEAVRNVPQGLKIVSNRLAAAGYSVPGLHNLAYEEPNDRVTEQKVEIHIHGSIYGVDELKRVIKTTVAETQRRVSLATNGVG